MITNNIPKILNNFPYFIKNSFQTNSDNIKLKNPLMSLILSSSNSLVVSYLVKWLNKIESSNKTFEQFIKIVEINNDFLYKLISTVNTYKTKYGETIVFNLTRRCLFDRMIIVFFTFLISMTFLKNSQYQNTRCFKKSTIASP